MVRTDIIEEIRKRLAAAFPTVEEAKGHLDYHEERLPNWVVIEDDESSRKMPNGKGQGRRIYERTLPVEMVYGFQINMDTTIGEINTQGKDIIQAIRDAIEVKDDFGFNNGVEDLVLDLWEEKNSIVLVYRTTVVVVVRYSFRYVECQ